MSTPVRRLALATAAIGCCSLLAADPEAPAGWTIFDVDNTLDRVDLAPGDGNCVTDQGTCTLRAAVMEANALGVNVFIRLPAGVFLLTRDPAGPNGGAITLTTPSSGIPNIVIRGLGASLTIVDANQQDRVFQVDADRLATLQGMTIRGGYATDGAGIANLGGLNIDSCVIHGNTATNWGGGIHNDVSGVLVVYLSTVSYNGALVGGGLSNFGESYLLQSSVESNVAQAAGGIFNSGSLEIDGCTVANNHAFGSINGSAGGIENTGDLLLTNSTISSNLADQHGGGLQNTSSATTWTYNATIVFNEADADQDFNGVGGGVLNEAGGVVNLRNSVVAGNNLSQLPFYDDCRGAIGSYGRNKFWAIPAQCTVTQYLAGDPSVLGSLAELGPLRFNGGGVKTHALIWPSDMIDGAEPLFGCVDSSGLALNTDQRAAWRPGAGVRCDIGAYEYEALPEGSLFADDFESGNLFAW